MSSLVYNDVLAAKTKLTKILEPTPLQYSERLSDLHGARVYLKREDLQPVRSYKIRGAYNAILSLTPKQREKGVVCASAGNHAQGVAWACARLHIQATIFMPATTPLQKINRVKYFGNGHTTTVLAGNTYDEAAKAATEFIAKSGAHFIHPFDDPLTIAGQGTVAAEIFDQLDIAPDAIVVPVGGGGLLAGTVVVAEHKFPKCRLYAVEPEGATSMAAAHKHGEPIELDELDTFVDGAAVRKVGKQSFSTIKDHSLELLNVTTGRLCTEMIDLYQNDGIVTEPAGALSVAALGLLGRKIAKKTVVCIVSGGNNDLSRYPEIVERSLIYQGLKHYFLVEFSQRPGQLLKFINEALGPSDDIVRFEYTKKNNKELGPALVGIQVAQKSDIKPLLMRMETSGITFQTLTDDRLLFDFLL